MQRPLTGVTHPVGVRELVGDALHRQMGERRVALSRRLFLAGIGDGVRGRVDRRTVRVSASLKSCRCTVSDRSWDAPNWRCFANRHGSSYQCTRCSSSAIGRSKRATSAALWSGVRSAGVIIGDKFDTGPPIPGGFEHVIVQTMRRLSSG